MDPNAYKLIANTKNAILDANGVLYFQDTRSVTTERQENAKTLAAVIQSLKKSVFGYRSFVELLTYAYYNWFPDYFFITPASSTGKYHPAFANKENGLVLHSFAVVKYTEVLMNIVNAHTDAYRDPMIYNQMICAAWFHDMFKYGDPANYKPGVYTDHGHPVYAADFFLHPDVIKICYDLGIKEDIIRNISDLIRTHMGPYTTNKYSNIVLESPKTPQQTLLYTADFLASRKETDVVKNLL